MLDWIDPAQDHNIDCKQLYLAYCPGYPLMVADWRTGHGYRDIRTRETIHPLRIAYINLPDLRLEN